MIRLTWGADTLPQDIASLCFGSSASCRGVAKTLELENLCTAANACGHHHCGLRSEDLLPNKVGH